VLLNYCYCREDFAVLPFCYFVYSTGNDCKSELSFRWVVLEFLMRVTFLSHF
jgi:hypothetical protein